MPTIAPRPLFRAFAFVPSVLFVLSVLALPARAANEASLIDLTVRGDAQGNATVTWSTEGDTVGHVDLVSSDGAYGQTAESAPVGDATRHAIVFSDVPTGTDLDLVVEAADGQNNVSRLGARFQIDEAIGQDLVLLGPNGPDPRLTPAPPKTNSAGSRPNPVLTTTTATASATPPGQGSAPIPDGLGKTSPLAEFFYLPLWTVGDQIIHLGDALWWLTLGLAALATLLELYFFFQRRRLWGVVYDARTKEPVELAVVRLFDQEHHKLLETRVTGRNGRFSFLGEKGEYYLEVTKEGYHFPSRIVTIKSDQQYTNVYRGEVIKLIPGQSLIAPDIPIDSEAGEVKKAPAWRRWLFPLLDSVRLPLLLLAFLLVLTFGLFIKFSAQDPPVGLPFVSMALAIALFLELFFTRRGRK